MPSPFSLLSAGMGGLEGLYSMGLGIRNLIDSGKIHPDVNTENIPQEIKDMLAQSQAQLNGQMPGTSLLEQNILANEGNTMSGASRGARGSSSFLAALASAQGASNSAFQNLQLETARNYQNNLNNLQRAEGITGQYKENQYQQDLQRKYDLEGAGLQDIGGGIGQMAQGAGMAAGMKSNQMPDLGMGGTGNMVGSLIGSQAGGMGLGSLLSLFGA